MTLRINPNISHSLLIAIFLTLLNGCNLAPFRDFSDSDDLAEQDAFSGYESGSSRLRKSSNQSKTQTSNSPFSDSSENTSEIQKALSAGVLITGMKTTDVLQIFGQPSSIEFAGESQFGNQRWLYENGVSDRWKLSTSRIIYFESGRVSGWKNFSTARSAL